MGWSAEQHDRMKDLWADGASSAQIAVALNEEFGTAFTRNAVLGRIHRLKLPTPDSKQERKKKPPGVNARARVAGFLLRKNLEPDAAPRPRPAPVSDRRRIGSEGVSLMELRFDHCRFPLWGFHERSGNYCGDQTVEGLPYCAVHGALVYKVRRPWTLR
jgi:GcrA cell cycle regulator